MDVELSAPIPVIRGVRAEQRAWTRHGRGEWPKRARQRCPARLGV